MRRFGALLCGLMVVSVTAFGGSARAEGFPTIDGLYSGTGPISAAGRLDLTVVGRGGVPASGVDAVAINVTVTNSTSPSYLTVWPTGSQQPTASNLNFGAGQTIPNMIIAKVGAGGQISIFNQAGSTDVIVDVLGWFPTGGSYTGLTPARLLETRPNLPTIDGAYAGVGKVGSSAVLDLPVVGRGGVPMSGVDAVALNVTVTNPTTTSYLTVWPTGSQQPTASNLNFGAGQTIPNMIIAKVGAAGQISIFNQAGSTDVIVDVLGWFPTGGSYTGLTPARFLETRPNLPTVDGAFAGFGKVGTSATTNVVIAGRGSVPASGVGAVALNVTVTNPTTSSYLTVWPTGEAQPTASNLNFGAGQTIPNMVVAKLGAGGQISIFNQAGSTDVIVDVLGWFPTGGSYTGLTPARLLDSRIVPPPAPAPTTPTTPAPEPSVATFRAGTYVVNSTIAPGRYEAAGAKRGCYWERLSGFGGSFGELISNDFRSFAGRVIVDISPTDAGFKFDADCGTFKTYVAPPAPAPTIVPGSHVVGANISPGTYTASVASGCYWERTRSFGQGVKDIIANDFISSAGTAVVTIQSSDVGFYADDQCGTWTPI